MDELVRRVERLERDYRRWRVVATAAMSALGCVVLAGAMADPPDSLSLRQLTIVDENGVRRIDLAGTTQTATITLTDQGGKPRIQTFVDAQGNASMGFFDRKGSKTRLLIGTNTDGEPIGVFRDDRGTARIGLGVTRSGPPIQVKDAAAKEVFKAP